jgi:hypothetical protein
MSYDISLMADTGGPESVEVFDCNHTSNTAQMWRDAGCDLAEFHGKPASELTPVIDQAIEKMKGDPDHFKQYDAPNGWGDYHSTLAFLSDIAAACRSHPKTTVEVSR